MSKSKVAMKNVAPSKKSANKKPLVNPESKVIKKTKANPAPANAAKKSDKTQSKATAKASQDKKAAPSAQVKKAGSAKENQKPVVKEVIQSEKPKRPLTSYFCFTISRRENFMKENQKLSLTEAAKALSEVWKAMDEKTKSKYIKMAEEHKKRYQKEMNDLNTKGYFINKDGENSREVFLEKQKKLSQVQPKRPLSAYMFFNISKSKEIRTKNPEIKFTDVFKHVAELWSKMTAEQKQKYVNLQMKDVQRNEKELKQLQTKGFFVNQDGVKSTEIIKKKFKFPEGTVMPKTAKSGYQIYVNENCQKIQEKQNLTHTEAMSVCKQVWEKLSDKQQAKYHDAHTQDVKRHEKQILQLQQKGYFTREDGSKSTDAAKSKK